jgi:hypothetical protein
MREFLNWLVVAFVLTSSAVVAQGPEVDALAVVDAPRRGDNFPAFVIPLATPVSPPLVSAAGWCEPIEPTPCSPDVPRSCSSAPDGTARVCSRLWHISGSIEHGCLLAFPTRDVQRWRSDRLRVIVDAVCRPAGGCDPVALHGYLGTLIMRETTWRPYKVHRLSADVDANKLAWSRYSERYIGNRAAGDATRWSVGRGYFGMNAAGWLWRWDVLAPPETLCGEVESVLVHLRAARERWHRLDAGVRCDDVEHHGTGVDGVSWYDVSLVNSGSEACPATDGTPLAVREGFEKRARSRGLSPYSTVSLTMLGRDVTRERQAEFAATVRARMDRQHPHPAH